MNSSASHHVSRDIQAVIFDKDGTLFDFEVTWMSYCDQMFEHIARDDLSLRPDLASFCGFNPETRVFQTGSLIVGGSIEQLCVGWSELAPEYQLDGMLELSASVISKLNPAPICDLRQLTDKLPIMMVCTLG